jgi:hypothetical protein
LFCAYIFVFDVAIFGVRIHPVRRFVKLFKEALEMVNFGAKMINCKSLSFDLSSKVIDGNATGSEFDLCMLDLVQQVYS